MNKKLTPWFPVSVKPARNGWYESRYNLYATPMSYEMRYFKNGVWMIDEESGLTALFGNTPAFPGEAWRGLAERDK